jgi:DNA polymerase-3 subunit gamma/tau
MDVLEIDGASNNGVDSVRELRDSARYAPSRDRYKIFIIDEVHMLSTQAFNALLKVLEEPPSHVVFIMATTERHKLPATILSRCQQFTFRTISAREIQEHLRQIADREGAKIDDRSLSYIVKAAEGSMRDAQSLLDQIISFSGQNIGDDDVRDVLGFIPTDILDRTTIALAGQDCRELLECVHIVVEQGLSIPQYIRECVGRMRDLLMIKLGLDDKVLASAEDKKELSTQASAYSEQDLVRNFDMLLRLENETRWTSQPRLHLEAGLVKMAKAGLVKDIEDVSRSLRKGSPNPASAPISEPAPKRVQPAIPTAPPPPPKAAPAPPPAAATTREAPPMKPPIAKERSGSPAPVADLDAAKEDPLVKRFLDVFKGDIAHVKPQTKPSEGESI